MPALRNARRVILIAALLAPVIAQPAFAQTYPSQNITFVVAFAAGGIADVVGRLIGHKVGERFKQNVVVENRGGAGGNLAARAVSTAAPDGYPILATTSALAVNDSASRNKGYATEDLRAGACGAFSPEVMAVSPGNRAKDSKELLANAKEKSFTYGAGGAGT